MEEKHQIDYPDASQVDIFVGDSFYDFSIRLCKFLITYVLYLLIMYIVLDFWDKLKDPTKAFLRDKIIKYVDTGVLLEFFKQTSEQISTEAQDETSSPPQSDEKCEQHRKTVESRVETVHEDLVQDISPVNDREKDTDEFVTEDRNKHQREEEEDTFSRDRSRDSSRDIDNNSLYYGSSVKDQEKQAAEGSSDLVLASSSKELDNDRDTVKREAIGDTRHAINETHYETPSDDNIICNTLDESYAGDNEQNDKSSDEADVSLEESYISKRDLSILATGSTVCDLEAEDYAKELVDRTIANAVTTVQNEA